jgi:hypothetical protein
MGQTKWRKVRAGAINDTVAHTASAHRALQHLGQLAHRCRRALRSAADPEQRAFGLGGCNAPDVGFIHTSTGTSIDTGRGAPDNNASIAPCTCATADDASVMHVACLVTWRKIAV